MSASMSGESSTASTTGRLSSSLTRRSVSRLRQALACRRPGEMSNKVRNRLLLRGLRHGERNVHRVLLQLGRQRAGELHALHRQDLADLVDAELDLAAPHRLGDIAALAEGRLPVDLLGDAQALQDLGDML